MKDKNNHTRVVPFTVTQTHSKRPYQHADWTEAENEEQDSRETRGSGEMR